MALLPLAVVAQPMPEDAFARVQRLNADLLSHPSATAVLERWCHERQLADPPTVRAIVDRAAHQPASAEQRARLGVGPDEPVAYRRVRLMCGDHLLSDAENWYVPARLTAEMNAALAGDAPFGTVIRPLAPTRRNLTARQLWQGHGAVPQAVLRQSALVSDSQGRPLAEVRETYQRDLVAGGP